MATVIRFNTTFYETNTGGESRPKFLAGEYYPVTEETTRHALHGIAEVVDAPDDADKAVATADKLQDKAAAAVGNAHDAQVDADAALAAKAIDEQRAALAAEIADLGTQIEAADDDSRPALQAALVEKQAALAAFGEAIPAAQ